MDEMELIQACRRGSYAAFEGLYRLYIKRALRTAYLITQSRPEAEDVAQEVFVQVWRRINALREPGAFRGWFYQILLHTAHRAGRKDRNVVLLPLELDESDKPDSTVPVPEEQVERASELEELRQAIKMLPDTHRVPLVLRYYSGLSEVEIAEVVEIPVGTVKSRLYNARQALQRALAGAEKQIVELQAVPGGPLSHRQKEGQPDGGRAEA